MRFVCDRMFARLGRWLRAAGHDTVLAPEAWADRQIVAWAAAEGRVVLTRDRKMLELREAAGGHVWVLRADTLDAAARELAAEHGLDWLRAPLTRCLVDNTPIALAGPDALALIPEGARKTATEVWRCPSCQRLYWEGGHAHRMRQRLEAWAAGAA